MHRTEYDLSDVVLQRAAGWCECGSIEFTEWPCEGGLKPKDSGVGVDGSPVRYQRGAYDSM